jgi:mevalonate kinase
MVTPIQVGEDHPPLLDPRLIDAITSRALPESVDTPKHSRAKSSAISFLYLYMTLRYADHKYVLPPFHLPSEAPLLVLTLGICRPAFDFTARSALPIGAGLGSSASYNSCVSAAMLLAYKRVTPPAPSPHSHSHGTSTSSAIHVSHQGRRAIPTTTADEINKWAFVAEKVMHGNPSGVDNSVSIHGGALAFARAHGGRKGKMEGIGGFKSVRFLLTDSTVPRDSKRLIAGVAQKLEEVRPRPIRRIWVVD